MPVTLLPPTEKLPLLARKDVRDSWESKKADLEKQLSEACGTAWTIDINPNAVYAYAPEDSYVHNALGAALTGYVEGAIYQLKRFRDNKGASSMDDLNAACRARTLTMAPDESEKFLYNGVDIDSTGRLRILFKPERLGVNLDECLADDKLADALNAAPVPEGSETGLPYNAKNSVEKGWTSKAEELRSSIADVLNNPDIKLTPNFEATFQKLTAAKAAGASLAVNEFDVSLGNFTAEYFSGLASYLKYKDFDKDDMLQEAFNEAVSKNEIAFRVVDSMKGTYGECVIEDGVLFLQSTPERWGCNISDIANDLLNLL